MEYTILSIISPDRWNPEGELTVDIVPIAKSFIGDTIFKEIEKRKDSILISTHEVECREAIMHFISYTIPNFLITSLVKVNLNNELSPKLRKIIVEIVKEFIEEQSGEESKLDLVLCKDNKLVFPSSYDNYNNCFTAASALIGLLFGLPNLIENNKFIGFNRTFEILRKSLMNKLPEEAEENDDEFWEDDGNRGRNENTPWNDAEYLLWYALYFSNFNFMDAAVSTVNDGLQNKLDHFNVEYLESKLQLRFTGPHDLINFIDYGVLRRKIKFSNKKILKSILGFGDKDFMKFISSTRFENKKIARVIRGLKNGSI